MGDALELHVNLDNMTIGDLETLGAPENPKQMIETLQRLIVGVDIRTLPIRRLADIAAAITEAVKDLQQAKN